jgi:hypothetical protein
VDLQIVIEEFQDYLAPTLDVYEQAVYLYIFRHSRLLGLSEAIIGFKSARLKIALGKGQEGARMAEHTCYEKLRSLEAKGCLRVLGTERGGTRICLNLPSEIPNLIPPAQHAAAITWKRWTSSAFQPIALRFFIASTRNASTAFADLSWQVMSLNMLLPAPKAVIRTETLWRHV